MFNTNSDIPGNVLHASVNCERGFSMTESDSSLLDDGGLWKTWVHVTAESGEKIFLWSCLVFIAQTWERNRTTCFALATRKWQGDKLNRQDIRFFLLLGHCCCQAPVSSSSEIHQECDWTMAAGGPLSCIRLYLQWQGGTKMHGDGFLNRWEFGIAEKTGAIHRCYPEIWAQAKYRLLVIIQQWRRGFQIIQVK